MSHKASGSAESSTLENHDGLASSDGWAHVPEPSFGLVDNISKAFERFETDFVGAFPNLRNATRLILASDYGGDHASASHTTITFVVADAESISDWSVAQQVVRNRFIGDGRRVSYKGLTDQQKMRALPSFLALANCIKGVVVSFVVDKSLLSLFQPVGRLSAHDPELGSYESWKPATIERALRISHIASMLLRGISGSGQDVLWITDEDEIVANESRLRCFVETFGNIANHYLNHTLGHCRVATSASDTGARDIEDLLAIPDLVSGLMADVAPELSVKLTLCGAGQFFPAPPTAKSKVQLLANWFSDNSQPLRRVVCLVDRGRGAKYRISCIRFNGTMDSIDQKQSFLHTR